MKSFDKNFVVFGRVIEGLRYLNKVSDKQNSHSLIPSTKLKIQDMKNFSRKPTGIPLLNQS